MAWTPFHPTLRYRPMLGKRSDSLFRCKQRRRLAAVSRLNQPAEPQFLASDKNGNVYVTNSCNGTITIFGNGSNGSAAPFATITVRMTQELSTVLHSTITGKFTSLTARRSLFTQR